MCAYTLWNYLNCATICDWCVICVKNALLVGRRIFKMRVCKYHFTTKVLYRAVDWMCIIYFYDLAYRLTQMWDLPPGTILICIHLFLVQNLLRRMLFLVDKKSELIFWHTNNSKSWQDFLIKLMVCFFIYLIVDLNHALSDLCIWNLNINMHIKLTNDLFLLSPSSYSTLFLIQDVPYNYLIEVITLMANSTVKEP